MESIELPGSGFSVKLPDEWSVEVLDPDRDYRSAGPGDTWTALRAYSADGIEACTVAVGVVSEGANDLELDVDTDDTAAEAYWRGRRRLMLPQPQVEPLGYGFGGVTGGFERRARSDPGIDHDVLLRADVPLGGRGHAGRRLQAVQGASGRWIRWVSEAKGG